MGIRLVSDQPLLSSEIAAQARQLGFDYFACGVRILTSVTQPCFILLNNYPAEWQQRYLRQEYMMRDPAVLHARRSQKPLVWDDGLFDDARDLWEDARLHGIRHGWSQSHFDSRSVGCMLSLARSHEAVGATEIEAKDDALRAMTNRVCIRLIEALLPPQWQLADDLLTPKQQRVLEFTADGKSCNDISDITGVSECTPRYHVENILVKLNAPNKAAAVARGFMRGLFT